MSKHTPGPWDDGIYHATMSGGRLIAYIRAPKVIVPLAAVPIEVDGYGRDEGEANCRIMTAAPELLEALRDFASMKCETVGLEDMEGGCCRTCRARAAIAKAEGRS